MAYFPAFINLNNKKVLLVGAGNIAGEKLEKLLIFTKNITVIAPEVSDKVKILVEENRLTLHKRKYLQKDIESFSVVIVAVDDLSMQKEIYEECQKHNILCNSVDSVEYCDFIFPSYIKKGSLTIAISTSGSSPSVAKYLRLAIENLIPDSIESFLDEMKKIRSTLPKGKERMKLLDEKAKKYIDTIFKFTQH
ncbi:precorrin-2 dehydrogenase/sirohydrochlorin ferrochelatase family protein [Hydrogenimonas thermophila]|uniref:precorrin-2 dehydrogenase n=1 Tax=Hydrogenimonas thermophila TaxID=223786 RepID=A0A1I5T0E0_9BACT|nr:bifunctional precorrin-2 dehydrogenase/sirohydrochlorin ferrochelatase [Hydrogenimonas thermophila]WOE70681.1 bifunctional precorrin-2 dehydrogenase/sirohydrochlorin ferrochelatase [Hydrogenimonas thermophila]WOE73199.1 bifunctional precorrin-2 dehydrogenase/sirohydrochlorin ferrochelatase [Hydrogenimonas thermophila]SFP76490.1 precorrin-2 dehydrogenase / sirohydrochlorin ferrochelatase [Hydrogenimonas thermophila]